MRKLLSFSWPLSPPFLFCCGCFFTVMSIGILALHAQSFDQKNTELLHISSRLPTLVSRIRSLRQSTQSEEYFLSNSLDAKEELTRATVLPDELSLSLFRRRFSQISAFFPSLSVLSITESPQKKVLSPSLTAHQVSITLRGTIDHVSRLLSLLDYSGKFLLSDVISATTQSEIFDLSASLPASDLLRVHQFFFTDLLTYSAHPTEIEQQFFGTLPLSLREEILAKCAAAGLSALRTELTPFASKLLSQRLFPFPLLFLQSLSTDSGHFTLVFDVYAEK
jgi:hypothetical protein